MTLGSIKQFGAKVSRAITAIRAHTVVAVGRKFRFRRNHQERHSDIANLRMFKFGFALRTNENPF
jgi:hypothetical protein